MTGVALKDGVDLISIAVPLQVATKKYKHIIFMFFWKEHNLVRPNHECERRYAAVVEHKDVVFLSL